jgi:PAS domain S-box-containing protein
MWKLAASAGLSERFTETAVISESGPLPPEPLVIESIASDARLAGRRVALESEGIRSMLAAPLHVNGDGFGTVVFYWREPHRIAADELRLATALAFLAASALGAADAAERRAAELDVVTDSVPALISYLDPLEKFRRVNHAYEEFFACKREDLVGKSVAEVVGPEHYAVAQPYLARALNGERVHFYSQVRHCDGELRAISVTYMPDADSDGTVRGLVVMVQDITERNRAEEARARLAAIVDSSDDAIVSKTLRGFITSWNRGAERIFGYTAEEAVGQHITLIIPPERRSEEDRVLAQLVRGEKVDHFETERRAKDGRKVYISLTVSPVRNSQGVIIGASKIARDITERKLAEEERALLLEREQRARETAELLNRVGPILAAELEPRKLTQKVTDLATSAVHAEFGALFHNAVNENGESYVLYTLSGVPAEAFANFPMPRNTPVFGPTFRGEGIVRSDDITKDPRYGKNPPYHGMPAGHLPVCSYLAAPVISRTGKVLGGLFFGHSKPGMFTEESERIAAGIAAQAAIALDNADLFAESQGSQQALLHSNEELKRVNEDLNQFAHSASHDLQEPLRMVAIYSQLLRRTLAGSLDAEREEYLEYVVRGAARMETLIRDLLAYTHASAVYDEAPPLTDAAEALNAALSNLTAAIDGSGATITHGPLPTVRIASIRLTQLFQNLVSNAIKYRGEQPPLIDITAARQGDEWVISVQDNGIGIDEQYKEYIFGIFKRLHTASEYSGTGIGLAICQRIVERAGGRIWVTSQPGEGATFSFTLPVVT